MELTCSVSLLPIHSHCSPDLTIFRLNAGFHQNGKPMQICYVVTLLEIVRHLEGGRGEH